MMVRSTVVASTILLFCGVSKKILDYPPEEDLKYITIFIRAKLKNFLILFQISIFIMNIYYGFKNILWLSTQND